jgi:hypothetical protein
MNSGFACDWGAQGGNQITTGREDFEGRNTVHLIRSEGLEIKHSDFDAEDGTLKGDNLWKVVEIIIGGVPTVIEDRIICLFMSVGTILLQGSISTNLFGPMRHQVDLRKVDVVI